MDGARGGNAGIGYATAVAERELLCDGANQLEGK